MVGGREGGGERGAARGGEKEEGGAQQPQRLRLVVNHLLPLWLVFSPLFSHDPDATSCHQIERRLFSVTTGVIFTAMVIALSIVLQCLNHSMQQSE